jgi:hypothetical protein
MRILKLLQLIINCDVAGTNGTRKMGIIDNVVHNLDAARSNTFSPLTYQL